jgi:hypothetical protein
MANPDDPFQDADPDPLLGDPVDDKNPRPSFVPEFVRKVAVAGLGAVFMTEEGLRNLAGQLKLPKEALGFIVSQAEKTKEEVGRVVSEEIRRFLQSEKLREEFLKLLAGMTMEIKAEVRLVPSDKPAEAQPDQTAELKVEPKVVVTDIGARRSKKAKKD